MNNQIEFIKADIDKMNGISVAVLNADNHIAGWSDEAYRFMLAFLNTNNHPFVAEEVRADAEEKGLPNPPDSRAWGAVILRVKKEGFIEFAGYQRTTGKSSHRRPATMWRKKGET